MYCPLISLAKDGVMGRSHFCCRFKYSALFENCNYVETEKRINRPTLKSLFIIQNAALPSL